MSVIEEIYINSNGVIEENMLNDREYENSKLQVDKCYKYLCKELTDDDVDILDKLMAHRDVQARRKLEQTFKTGFAIGLSTAVEALM